jgi:hypothetical protein
MVAEPLVEPKPVMTHAVVLRTPQLSAAAWSVPATLPCAPVPTPTTPAEIREIPVSGVPDATVVELQSTRPPLPSVISGEVLTSNKIVEVPESVMPIAAPVK